MPFDDFGYELIKEFITAEVTQAIICETDSSLSNNKGGGVRHAEKKYLTVWTLANSAPVLKHAEKYLTGEAHLVRAILFDKSAENNWSVGWHQDKTVAVTCKFEADGWGPWSVKEGIHHVQPPAEVLNNMVAFRIHLDESNHRNGCLKLISGSHRWGILSPEKIHQVTEAEAAVTVEAPALSALVMRPHLLHASSKATKPSRRRVLHLEYSSYKLSNGVEWAGT